MTEWVQESKWGTRMDGIALSGRDLLDQIASFHVFMKNETFLSEWHFAWNSELCRKYSFLVWALLYSSNFCLKSWTLCLLFNIAGGSSSSLHITIYWSSSIQWAGRCIGRLTYQDIEMSSHSAIRNPSWDSVKFIFIYCINRAFQDI